MTDAHLIAELKTLDTTTLTDAMDRLRLPVAGLAGLKPVLPGRIVCGPAFTVRFSPVEDIRDSAGDFLDDVPPGRIVALDNRGRTDSTVWGDIMAIAARERGVEASFIDGVCRDVTGVREADYPIFSKGHYMITGKGRTKLDAVEVPITLCDVMVRPGDMLFGDDNGAIVMPAARVADILEVAKEIAATEAEIIAHVRAGSTLREAREKLGYHSLQTPRD